MKIIYNRKQISMFFTSLVFSAGLLSTTIIYGHSATVTTPGNVCQPANLTQAINRGMSWNQFRVYNPSATQNFFVTCGISRSAGDNNNGIIGYVSAHFAVGHNNADEVACIWRSNNFDVDDGNIGTSVLAITDTIARGGATTPVQQFNNSYDLAGTFPEATDDRYWTVTCNLPAKTGINLFGVIGTTV